LEIYNNLGYKIVKKLFKLIILSTFAISLLSANVAFASNAVTIANDSQSSIEEQLIGTWRWEDQHSWLLVFSEDGTVLDGPPGMRVNYNWQIVDGRLLIDGADQNMRIDGNTLTLDRLGSTYTYNWYSASTEAEESFWALGIIALGCIAAIVVIVIAIIVFFVLRSRKQKEEMQAQMNQMQSQLHGQQQQFGNQPPPPNNHQSPINRH